MKTELEEAAEKRIPTSPKVWDLTETRRSDFKAGANYQAERMYSEEEVLKAQQAILCNIKDALMNENYIIEYLNNLKTNKL